MESDIKKFMKFIEENFTEIFKDHLNKEKINWQKITNLEFK